MDTYDCPTHPIQVVPLAPMIFFTYLVQDQAWPVVNTSLFSFSLEQFLGFNLLVDYGSVMFRDASPFELSGFIMLRFRLCISGRETTKVKLGFQYVLSGGK